MREILFRGKRIDNGEWIYGYGAIDNDLLHLDFLKGIVRVHCRENTVGQYTGLTDKNGERAFEGDKIEEGKSVGIIKFGDGQFYIEWIENKDFWSNSIDVHLKYGEIIGNIYGQEARP